MYKLTCLKLIHLSKGLPTFVIGFYFISPKPTMKIFKVKIKVKGQINIILYIGRGQS